MRRKRARELWRMLVAAAAAVLLMGSGAAQDATCSNPTGRRALSEEERESVADRPGARARWFLEGRRPPGGGLAAAQTTTPARRLLESLQQISQMRPRRGLAAAPPEWMPLGPAPQRSLYWGNVSGRVTSLAVDERGGNHILYVGTAFGGLWMNKDYLAATPHFTSLATSAWPTLAIGSIAVDPSVPDGRPPVIYAGTGEANDGFDSYYGMGILKSTDGGASWSLSTGSRLVPLSSPAQYDVTGPFVGSAIGKIVIDSANPKRLLAAVTSSSLANGKTTSPAIYQSVDGGGLWTAMRLADWNPGDAYNCTDLIQDPFDGKFYAAIQSGGIYRLDAGATEWTATSSPFGSTTADWFNFYRASLVARAGGAGSELYALISAGDFGENDSRTYDLSRPTSADTGLVRSLDGGATWTPVPAPDQLFNAGARGQGFYDQWIAAPRGGDSLLVGGIDVWRAPSAASPSWSNVTRGYDWGGGLADPARHVHPDQHAVIVLGPQDWIVGNDGGVWRTADGGAAWINLNTDMDTIQFMSVTPIEGQSPGYLGGSQDNGTTVGQGIGQPWDTTLTGDGGYTAGNPRRPNHYFTERTWVSLCRSEDSGRTWKTVVDRDTIEDATPFYAPYQIAPDGETILLGTNRVWLGPAAPDTPGKDWTAISEPLGEKDFIQAIAVAPSAPQKAYVTTRKGGVWFQPDLHAANSTGAWVPVRANTLPPQRVFAAVAVDPQDDRIAYIGVLGFGTGHVFRTDDGGRRWRNVTPFVTVAGRRVAIDVPVNAILVDPQFPADVYVATDLGVFASSDRGANWQPYGAGMPRTAVLDLKMSAARRIVAGTHGRGAWWIEPLPHAPQGRRTR